MKGKHDDLIMALAMALYVGESSFSQLQKSDEMTKAMLNSWVGGGEESSESNVELRPVRDSSVLSPRIKHGSASKEIYKEYSWLFGKGKIR